MDQVVLEDVRAIRKKVTFPRKLDISVFYQLTGRLPHEELVFKEEDFITHFYDTFVAASIKLVGKRDIVVAPIFSPVFTIVNWLGKIVEVIVFWFNGLKK